MNLHFGHDLSHMVSVEFSTSMDMLVLENFQILNFQIRNIQPIKEKTVEKAPLQTDSILFGDHCCLVKI